ncbi:MAG: RNA polymerase sigma factor [Myxococcaceae bacterium]
MQPPLSELYVRHRRKALAIARRILRDEEEAEDVVQEVFARLHVTAATFNGKSAYSTWLYRVMFNSAVNVLRARHRREQLSLSPAIPISPEQSAIGHELGEHLSRALAQVSEQHQQVLRLRELRGLSYPEIAALLHIPEGTVKSALNRGRTRVSELLRERGVKMTDL